MWTVKTLQLGYPGKTTHHGGLGWSTIGLARDGHRVVILDTGGFPARRNIVAGLAAEGRSEVHEPHHLRRGYEHFERKMGALGGQVWSRISDPDDFIFAGC